MMLTKRLDPILLVLRDDLSPEDTAMLQALYSRSAESVLTHLAKIDAARRAAVRQAILAVGWSPSQETVDAVIAAALGQGATARAGSLMRNHYVGFNHKSIGDCGTTTMWIENVSLLAAKAVQDNPLYNGQETSTRYIDMAGRLMVDPVGTHASRGILDRWMSFYAEHQGAVVDHVRAQHPRQTGEDEDVYEKAVKARAFDILRGWLPAGVTTQLSWHTNLRQAGDKLAWMRHHPAAEMRTIASGLHDLLSEAYPSSAGSLGAARVSGVADDRAAAREAWERRAVGWTTGASVEQCPEFATTIDAVLLRRQPWLEERPRGCVLPWALTDLGQITSRFLLDFGSFRDLQRHRAGVCRMPTLTMRHGFESWYRAQLPTALREAADDLLVEQQQAIRKLDCADAERQYYIPIGYRVPCQVTYGLPGAVYLMEIRSSKTVHATLRRAIHGMVRSFQLRFPTVALHADMDEDDWTVRRGKQTITQLGGAS